VRLAIYFAAVFGGVVLPFVVALPFSLLGPPPYILVGDGPGQDWADGRGFDDGSRVVARRMVDARAARDEARRLFGSAARASSSETLGLMRYRGPDDRRGLVLAVGNVALQIEAPTADGLDRRLAALPFVAPNPRGNPLLLAFTTYLPWTMAGFALYIAVMFVVGARGAGWAAQVLPGPTAPAPAAQLRQRLLAINGLDLPFQVREEPSGRLIAEWRIADARWAGPLQAGGLMRAHRVHIDLDETDHRARVVDASSTIDWSATAAALRGNAAFFRGITFFQYERGRAVGLLYKPDGTWGVRDAYNYRFDLGEMKIPLIDAVTGSGWTWAPVVSFYRPIGG